MDFKGWFYILEDVRQQKAGFTQLFRSMFPNAEVAEEPNHVKAVAPNIAGRNLVVHWYPGTNHRRPGDETQEQDSFVKIDFFHSQAVGTTDQGDPDYMGGIRKDGITPNTMEFTKTLMKFVRGLKGLGLHIMFDAVGMDRADSYAEILKKMGYQLGYYRGQVQMWLAKPVEGMAPTDDPYKDVAGAAMKRKRRETAVAEPQPATALPPSWRLTF